MANEFIQTSEKWTSELHVKFAQQIAKFMGSVRDVKTDNSKTYHFSTADNVDAIEGKNRAEEYTLVNQVTNDVPCTAKMIYCAAMIDDFDQARVRYDYRSDLSNMVMGAINRAVDDNHIATLNTATNSEIVLPTANTLNLAGLQKMEETLELSDATEGELYAAISPGAVSDLRGDSTVVGNFNFDNSVVKEGAKSLNRLGGFNLIRRTRLPNGAGGGTERRCFFWNKKAVGAVYWKKPEFRIDYDIQKGGYLLVGRVWMNRVIIDQSGVYYADVTN